MKKCIVTIAVLLATVSASAQEFTDTPSFYTGTDKLRISLLDYFGVGVIIPGTGQLNLCGADFINNTSFGRNRDIFFNLASFEYRPFYGSTLGLGMDMHWDAYRLDKTHYWLPEDYDCVSVADANGAFSKVTKSTLRVLSFDFPLDYTQQFGPVAVTLGVSAELNMPAFTKFKGVDTSGAKVKQTARGPLRSTSISTQYLSANFHAYLTYYGIGLFVKYRPTPQFPAESGPYFTSWSAGLLLR